MNFIGQTFKRLIVITLCVLALIISGCDGELPAVQAPVNSSVPIIEVKPPVEAATPAPSASANTHPIPGFKYNEYNIKADIDPVSRQIEGVETIIMYNWFEAPLNEAYFNVSFNAFSKDIPYKPYFPEYEQKIFGSFGEDYGYFRILGVTVNGAPAAFDYSETVLGITLSEPVLYGHSAEISLQFEAYVPKISHRTGANNYAVWLGNFFPTLAVYDGKNWLTNPYYPAGDPFVADTANYTLRVNTPAGYTVVGSGEEETVSFTDETRETLITAKMVRDITIAVSNSYQVISRKLDSGGYVNFHHYSHIENIDEIMDYAVKAMEHYTETVGAYPYSSLDIIETELFLEGGMEYSQIIFLDTARLMKDNNFTTVVHEIGHQWFYNILGSNQITEPWLDEGLTLFLQGGVLRDKESTDTVMQSYYDTLKSKLPSMKHKTITGGLSVFDNWQNYYDTQYRRSCLMFYSLSKLMGDEPFSKLIKQYYEDGCYRISSGDIFIQTAEEIHGERLTEFFDAWLNGEDLPALLWEGGNS